MTDRKNEPADKKRVNDLTMRAKAIPSRNEPIIYIAIEITLILLVQILVKATISLLQPSSGLISFTNSIIRIDDKALLFGEKNAGYSPNNMVFYSINVFICVVLGLLWAVYWVRASRQHWRERFSSESSGSLLVIFLLGSSLLIIAVASNVPGVENGFYGRVMKLNIYVYTFFFSQLCIISEFVLIRMAYLLIDNRLSNLNITP